MIGNEFMLIFHFAIALLMKNKWQMPPELCHPFPLPNSLPTL